MAVQYQFEVSLTGFYASNLTPKDRNGFSDPYLKLDFDNFKQFKTDFERRNLNPTWGFQRRFIYRTKYLERLNKKFFTIKCFDHDAIGKNFIGESRMDLLTLATGPTHYQLSLKDEAGHPAGNICFNCEMKMLSAITLTLADLRLKMHGAATGAGLVISNSVCDELVKLPFNKNGHWPLHHPIAFESSISDILNFDEVEYVKIDVVKNECIEGEAILTFQATIHDITKADQKQPLSLPVTLQGQPVGELTGSYYYRGLPYLAQMIQSTGLDDGKVSSGYLAYQGLAPPPGWALSTPPPLIATIKQSPAQHKPIMCAPAGPVPLSLASSPSAVSAMGLFNKASSPPSVSASRAAPTNSLKDVPMPPNWQARKDPTSGRVYFADSRNRGTTWTDPRFLPENWDQRIEPNTGKLYFAFHKTKTTTYLDPRGFSDGWEMRLDEKAKPYFAFHAAKTTSYTDPRGLPTNFCASLDASKTGCLSTGGRGENVL
eukprot:Platyproteum_vivax@DN6427_c0_g1_i2.p1